MKKALALLVITSASLLTLVGCSNQPEPTNPMNLNTKFEVTDISEDFFTNTESPIEEYTELPLITDLKADTFVFVTGGSGSCAPEIEDIEVTPLTNTIVLKSLGDVACTADFVLYAYKVDLDNEINPDITFQVKSNDQITNAYIK